MTTTQKPQKAKARRGLCMAAGGVIDPNGNDYDAINAEKTARWAAEDAAKQVVRGPMNGYQGAAPAPIAAAAPAAAPIAATLQQDEPPETTFQQDLDARQTRMEGLRARLNGMEQTGRSNSLMGASSSLGFDAGGVVDPLAAAKAQSDAILAKYGVSGNAPAPAPVQVAPAPAPAAPAVPSGIRGWAVRNIPAAATLLNRGRQLDDEANPATNPGGKRGALPAAPGAAHGAVGVDGMIRGPGTAHSDSIPARIGGTEFNVANGEKLAILPAKVAKNPEALNQIEEIIEGETGKPVNRGLRSGGGYVDGLIDDEVRQRAAMARQQVPTAGPAPAAPAAPAAAPAAPAAAPAAPMMQPLEVPAAKPAAPAPRAGIAGQFDKAKAAASGVIDKAKSFTGGGAEATKQAAKGIKWYQPSPGVQAVFNGGKNVVGGAARLAAPVAALAGAYDAVDGFASQNSRDAEDIDNRGGFLASAAKDAFPGISAVGEKLGTNIGRLVTAATGGINPDTGKRESLRDIGNNPVDTGESVPDIYKRNTGRMTDSEYKRNTAEPTAEELKRFGGGDGGTQVGNPATAEAANPNIAALRAAGVQGDVGAQAEWKQDGAGRSYQSTPNKGIRQIATVNGDVYAGRDAKGQLNITSNVGQTPAEDEAARAKEATRMNSDLARQKATFAELNIDSDLNSNFAPDRARGLAAQAKRAQDQANAVAQRHNDVALRGQDMQLLGHQLDTQAKMATLRNQQQTQQAERVGKYLDNILGPVMTKTKDGEVPNAARQRFEKDLTLTLGEAGRNIGELTPKDLQEFQVAHDMALRAEPGEARKLYMNWIQNRPFVRDHNPHRQTVRGAGAAGKNDALGNYAVTNGWDANVRDVTDASFLDGSYDINAKRLLDR